LRSTYCSVASTSRAPTCGRSRCRNWPTRSARTPLDECGHVYKDLGAVLGVLEAEGIARVARRLYPVANIKGTD
jgi:hypothetical protein